MFIHNKKKKFVLSVINVIIELVSIPARLLRRKIDPRLINPAKILLLRLDHIGDVVMTSPSFSLMRERFPNSKIYLLTNGAGKQLYKEDHRIDEIWVFNWPWGQQRIREKFSWSKIKELWGVISKLRRENMDVVVDFRGDLRFIFLFGVLTGARFRVSNSRSGKSSLLHHISDYDVSRHEVERSLDVIRCFGNLEEPVRPSLSLNQAEISEVRQLVAKCINGPFPGKLAVVGPYSSRDVKSWPSPYFVEVIKYLREHDFTVLVVGTAEDRKHAGELIGEFTEGVYSFAGITSVRELAAMVSISSIVVGVDTGVLHLAACFDVPIVALFGSTRSVEFRPYSPFAIVVESSTCTCNQFLHLSCNKQLEGYAHCMADLKPAAAIRAIEAAIAG
ncbi:MAG: glycosyltransferase family 9 protein [Daejeonella sp.]